MYGKKLSTCLLIAVLAITGCSGAKDDRAATNQGPSAGTKAGSDAHATHVHHGVGPNGGVVFDLGKHHAEFTVDHAKNQCMIVVLGVDEKSLVPVAAQDLTLTTKETKTADGTTVPSMTIELLPQDETDGKATTFIGTNPGLGNVADFDGAVLGLIDGKPSQGEFSESENGGGHAHSHAHGADDALVWKDGPKTHNGLEIKLGHHGQHLHAGETVEPAVSITRDGQPVSDAKVFNSLLSGDKGTVLAEEVATIFEPTTPEEPAHYAQGALAIPKDGKQAVIRFRIVPADGDEATFDVPIQVE